MSIGNTTNNSELQVIAEKVSGRTLPNKTDGFYLRIIRNNIGTNNTEGTSSDTTIQDTSTDTLVCDTTSNPINVTLDVGFFEDGAEITIIDVGDASVNNITVQTVDSTPLSPSDPVVIDVAGGAGVFQYISTESAFAGASSRVTVTGTVGSILGGL